MTSTGTSISPGRQTVLLIGVGLMGGDLLFKLLKSGIYDVTVLARNDETLSVVRGLGVKTIKASLQDADVLTKEVASHDITINAASADDLEAAKAMIEGLRQSGGTKTFIQISGAGVYGHLFNPNRPADFVYDDNRPDDIDQLDPDAPHRRVDMLFRDASKQGLGKVVIAIPSTVYGGAEGPFKGISIQIPMKVEAALRDGYASYGSNDGRFTHIHVEDHSRAILLILESLSNGKLSVKTNPYINIANSQRSNWSVVAHRIAKQLHKHRVLSEPLVRTQGEWDFYGIYDSSTSRLRELGWYERFGSAQDFLDGIDFEVESVLLQKGLIPKPTSTPTPTPTQTTAQTRKDVVLVTGASGWIGSAVALRFLRHARGFTVRLALRSIDQFEAWTREYPQWKHRLEFVEVTSLTDPEVWKDAVKGVRYVAHVASPGAKPTEDVVRDLLEPAIQGTVSILQAATKEPSIEAVVFTSSIVAHVDLFNLRGPDDPPYVETDRNMSTVEQALALPKTGAGPLMAYAISKTLADRAAFKFVAEHKPHWRLNAVSPCWVTGPSEQPDLASVKDLRSTSQNAYQSIIDVDKVKPCTVPWFTDVRDVARVHVEAVLDPKISGRRYLLAAGRTSYEQAANTLRKALPESADRIGHTDAVDLPPAYGMDGKPAENDFDFEYIQWEKSMLDWGRQVLALPAE